MSEVPGSGPAANRTGSSPCLAAWHCVAPLRRRARLAMHGLERDWRCVARRRRRRAPPVLPQQRLEVRAQKRLHSSNGHVTSERRPLPPAPTCNAATCSSTRPAIAPSPVRWRLRGRGARRSPAAPSLRMAESRAAASAWTHQQERETSCPIASRVLMHARHTPHGEAVQRFGLHWRSLLRSAAVRFLPPSTRAR